MNYIIIEKFPEIDCVLIKRDTPCCPFVACWGYNEKDNSWSQGHYFESIIDASCYIKEKLITHYTEFINTI